MVDSNYERAIKEQIIYTNDWESCTNLVDTKRVGGFKMLMVIDVKESYSEC